MEDQRDPIDVVFLFDSGARTSIMSIKGMLKATESSAGTIKGIGGEQKVGYPKNCVFTLNCDKNASYEHKIKPTEIPGESNLVILGVDFLSKFSCTEFDWNNSKIRLGDQWIYYNSPLKEAKFDISDNLLPTEKQCLLDLINCYDDLFVHDPKAPRKSCLVPHVIDTGHTPPHKDKPRRYPQKWVPDMNSQLRGMLDNEIVRPSASPYSSNAVMITKKDDSLRFCVDFRTLNDHTAKDTYPLPNVQDIIDNTRGSRYFSQVDLASGYWGIPIHEKDSEKTAFVMPNGKFEFVRMPFGLCNAQATFQRNMDGIVEEVKEQGCTGVAAYVDNIIVHSATFEEHIETLGELFAAMDQANLSLRADKCEFGKSSIRFLGFIIDGVEVKPDPENIDKVKLFPVPSTRKKLRRFLGLANFNRRFVKNYTMTVIPLNELTSDKVSYVWEQKHQEAFDSIKDQLAAAQGLRLPDWSQDFHIRTDASDQAIGNVLFQIGQDGLEYPLAYHSKALSLAEKKWTTTEKEMLAIVEATRKFAPYCANKIHFHTDHLPLQYIRKQKDPRGKIARWLCELENFCYEIHYIKGKDNWDADYLSRLECEEEQKPLVLFSDNRTSADGHDLSTEKIKKCQREDHQLSSAISQLESKGTVKNGIFRTYHSLSVRDGILYKGERVVLPNSLTKQMAIEMHGQYHAGIENTLLLLKQRFYWRGMAKVVKEVVNNCRTCQQCKPRSAPKAELQTPNREFKPLERLCIDVATMPLSKKGNNKFLLMIDDASKFVATVPMPNETAEVIKQAIWSRWIPYFGLPLDLHSDQGSNVDGKKVRELCKLLCIEKTHSSPYHPEGNGLAERYIASIKTMVSSVCEGRKLPIESWDEVIDECTLAQNNTVNQSSKFSSALLLFGNNTRLPIDNMLRLQKTAREEDLDREAAQKNALLNQKEARTVYKERYDQTANSNEDKKFEPGDKVLLKRTFGPYPKISVNWKCDVDGNPYIVEKRIGPVNYSIRNSRGVAKIYHRNLITAALTHTEPLQTLSSVRENSPDIANIDENPKSKVVISIPTTPGAVDLDGQAATPVTLDREQFARNVLNGGNQVPRTNQHQAVSRTQTRSGRISKPVQRLIDEL